jgi:hypothetical protein
VKIKIQQIIERSKTIDIATPYYYHLDRIGESYRSWTYGKIDGDCNHIMINETHYDVSHREVWEMIQGEDLPSDWHLKKNRISEGEFLGKLDEFVNILLGIKEKS